MLTLLILLQVGQTIFEDLFNEFLFGAGAWVALILICGFMLLIGAYVRYSSILFVLILVFLFLMYLDEMGGQISVTSNFMWASIISLVAMGLMCINVYNDLGKRR